MIEPGYKVKDDCDDHATVAQSINLSLTGVYLG